MGIYPKQYREIGLDADELRLVEDLKQRMGGVIFSPSHLVERVIVGKGVSYIPIFASANGRVYINPYWITGE